MFYMSNDEKKNRDLDELLNGMPKFKDNRSKEEVFNRVKLEMDSSNINKIKKHNKPKSKWMPLIISIASVLLLTILVSSYLDSNSQESASQHKESEQRSDTMRTMEMAPTTESEAKEESSKIANDSMNSLSMDNGLVPIQIFNNNRTVYEEDLNGGTPFHFSVTDGGMAYPITIIIPKEKLDIEFPKGWQNSLQLYDHYASKIDEIALGFEDYLPFQGYFIAEGDTLQHYLPQDHGYDTASATTSIYGNTIRNIFSDFSYLERLNEDGTPVNWDQVGIMEKQEIQGKNAVVYYKHVVNNGNTFLVSSSSVGKSAAEPFVEIKDSINELYTTVIPSGVDYQISIEGDTVIIKFDEMLDLASLEYEDSIFLIEGITLTAASIDKAVRLENVEQKQWDRFDLTTTLPVPVGPNGYIMN